MDIRLILAKNVQRLRRERGLTQEMLAFEAGIHRTYVPGIEAGQRNPSIVIVAKLADTLKVKPGSLLEND